MNKSAITILAVVLIVLLGIWVWQQFPGYPDGIACTLEAKLCSDGSYVGRGGSKCEFAACPGSISTWTTSTNTQIGTTFRYPAMLATKYISTVDWPPVVQILDDQFTCTEAGNETDHAGRAEKQTINGRDYCVTTVAEGAAGSIYRQYAYAFEKEDGTAILTFTLRFVQCGNYDDSEKTMCEAERESFALDEVIDRIASTLVLN